MYVQYDLHHLHEIIRWEYATRESTWSPDTAVVVDVSNIHDMIGDSKYLLNATQSCKMTSPCESDQISDAKKILNAVREIFSYYFESSSFYSNLQT